jgi:hypothetical protein
MPPDASTTSPGTCDKSIRTTPLLPNISRAICSLLVVDIHCDLGFPLGSAALMPRGCRAAPLPALYLEDAGKQRIPPTTSVTAIHPSRNTGDSRSKDAWYSGNSRRLMPNGLSANTTRKPSQHDCLSWDQLGLVPLYKAEVTCDGYYGAKQDDRCRSHRCGDIFGSESLRGRTGPLICGT